MFALTRSNLLKQLPDENGIILRLTEIATVRRSMGINFKNGSKSGFSRFGILIDDLQVHGFWI